MIITGRNGKGYLVEPMSLFLNTIGFVALIASWWDGIPAIIVALLIFIYDAISNPQPVLMELEEVGEDDDVTMYYDDDEDGEV